MSHPLHMPPGRLPHHLIAFNTLSITILLIEIPRMTGAITFRYRLPYCAHFQKPSSPRLSHCAYENCEAKLRSWTRLPITLCFLRWNLLLRRGF